MKPKTDDGDHDDALDIDEGMFGANISKHLNEGLDETQPNILERLRQARQEAVANKREEPEVQEYGFNWVKDKSDRKR